MYKNPEKELFDFNWFQVIGLSFIGASAILFILLTFIPEATAECQNEQLVVWIKLFTWFLITIILILIVLFIIHIILWASQCPRNAFRLITVLAYVASAIIVIMPWVFLFIEYVKSIFSEEAGSFCGTLGVILSIYNFFAFIIILATTVILLFLLWIAVFGKNYNTNPFARYVRHYDL